MCIRKFMIQQCSASQIGIVYQRIIRELLYLVEGGADLCIKHNWTIVLLNMQKSTIELKKYLG